MAKNKDTVGLIANILLIIGGLNWGLVGINRGWDLVNLALGGIPLLATIVYILVGLSAVYAIIKLKK